MGCGSSSADAFAETIATAAVMDLALAPGLTDADAASVACDAQPHRPLALRMPRWGRPGAALSGDGLAQLCLAGAGSLRSVELNEAAVPRVTPEAAAQALGLLGDVREVSLRGESLPRRVLAVLGSAGAMPMTTVRSVLLGGRGVDAVALAALPRAFPCVERLYLQGPTGVVEWRSTVAGLVQRGVVLSHVTHVVFDTAEPLDADTERALRPLWPHINPRGVAHPAPACVQSIGGPRPQLSLRTLDDLCLQNPLVMPSSLLVPHTPGKGEDLRGASSSLVSVEARSVRFGRAPRCDSPSVTFAVSPDPLDQAPDRSITSLPSVQEELRLGASYSSSTLTASNNTNRTAAHLPPHTVDKDRAQPVHHQRPTTSVAVKPLSARAH